VHCERPGDTRSIKTGDIDTGDVATYADTAMGVETMPILKRLMLAGLTALWLINGALMAEEQQDQQAGQEPQQTAPAGQAGQQTPGQDLFPPDQIEQLVAPIALYPDALIAQMLMAATYPLDVVQADRWMRDREDLEGEALEKAAEEQPWDPSIKTLVFFPSVLQFMSENLDWTQDLGDAMLAQQGEVMAAVQKLRNDAQDAGTLETTEQQRVETEGDTIVIQPADPEVVYVPTYNASAVYGQTAPPATTYYPATYTTPVTTTDASSSSDSWINFGVGALAGGLLTAAILWDKNDYNVYYGGRGRYGAPGYWGSSSYWGGGWKQPVNINRDFNISRGDVNIDREIKKWEHNPERRGSVRYRDNSTKQKYASVRKERSIDREVARGRDPDRQRPGIGGDKRPGTKPAQRPATRDASRPSKPTAKPAKKPTAKPAQRSAAKSAAKPAKKPAAKPAQRPARSGGGNRTAFNVNKGSHARAASNRGAASRGGSRPAKRSGGGHRSGGGGRRR
jgi:hypothetical protein